MAIIDWANPEFVLIAGLAVVLGLAVVAAWLVMAIGRDRGRTQMAQLNLEQTKLQIVQRRQELEDLENASHVLSDAEKQRLDALREDISVLSRRNIAMRGEVEARLARLERAVEYAKMAGQLDTIKEKESKLLTLGRVS